MAQLKIPVLIDRIDFGKVISIQNIEADILAQRYWMVYMVMNSLRQASL